MILVAALEIADGAQEAGGRGCGGRVGSDDES